MVAAAAPQQPKELAFLSLAEGKSYKAAYASPLCEEIGAAYAQEAIDDKIAKMREKLKGAVNNFSNFIKDAAKKFFKWALEKLGLDAEAFFATLAKAGDAIKAIFKSPGKFFSNLIAAVKGSIDNFKTNFTTYLTGALFDWLTGAVGSIITLPKTFDVEGVLSVIMQLAGISWAFIRNKLVNIFGEQKIG